MNDNSLYLIYRNDPLFHTDNYHNNYDNYNIIFNRIINKKFAFIKINFNLQYYILFIDEAYNLLKKKWVMDDYYHNNNSILFNWSKKNDNNYRLNYNEEDYIKLKSNNNCVICGCDFTENCIVINTRCNHNFHWYCNNTTSGLKYWIKHHKNSCPVCRSENFI